MMKDYIELYQKLGLNFFPCVYGRKEPLIDWKELQTRKLTDEEIKKYFLSGSAVNIGIVCGEISGNLVVLDWEDWKKLTKVMGETIYKETLTARSGSGKGGHVYLRSDYPVPTLHMGDIGLDIQSTGAYVVAPPSLHPSGKEYLLESDAASAKIMTIHGDFIEEIFNLIKEKKIKGFNPDKHRERIDIDRLLEGVGEGERNNAAIKVATWYRIAGYPIEQTFELMKEWNRLNHPPIERERELQSTIESAFSNDEPYHYKFNKQFGEQDETFTPEVTEEANVLLNQKNILSSILKAQEQAVGEEKTKISLHLLQLRKESMDLSGASGSGKNNLCDGILECYPRGSWWKITGTSDKSLRYLPRKIGTLYLAERRATGKPEEETNVQFDIKLSISEGKLSVLTAEKTPEGRIETKKHETGVENIIMTSTDVAIPPELENRLWELNTDESRELNLAVVKRRLEESAKLKSERINRTHEQLVFRCATKILYGEAPKDFSVPFAPLLYPILEALAADTRVRRDVNKIIKIIEANALLHYRTRPIVENHIVCLPEDLLNTWEYIKDAILGTFTTETPRFWEYYRRLKEKIKEYRSVDVDLAAQIWDVGAKAANLWLNRMQKAGLLTRREEQTRGRPKTYYEEPDQERNYLTIEIPASKMYQLTLHWLEDKLRKSQESMKNIPFSIFLSDLQNKIKDTSKLRVAIPTFQFRKSSQKPSHMTVSADGKISFGKTGIESLEEKRVEEC